MLCAAARNATDTGVSASNGNRVAGMRAGLLIAICALFAACGGSADGPEAQLRAWVSAMEQAAEEKDRRAMLDRISENYTDTRGNSRKDVGETLLVYFLRQQTINIISTIDEITMSGDFAAKMALTVAMSGSTSGSFGLTADAYNFELELENNGDDWLLIGARWGVLGEDPH